MKVIRCKKCGRIKSQNKEHICPICAWNKGTSGGIICFDHNHTTNNFRGWICMHCNFALGLVHEDKNILRLLIKYLEKHEQK